MAMAALAALNRTLLELKRRIDAERRNASASQSNLIGIETPKKSLILHAQPGSQSNLIGIETR